MTQTLVIVGPTASGKTALALALARRLGGEVVSADSRQVYRRLDAGTAKPRLDALGRAEGVPCHLLDVADPSESFDAGRFAALSRAACAAIRARGRLPIVAGWTGLYVRAFLEGLAPMPRRDEGLRRALEAEARRRGRAWLHERLAKADPEAAARSAPNNIQRVIRALEVWELTGRGISSHWRDGNPGRPSSERPVVLSIEWSPQDLRSRIEERTKALWPGLLEEARLLAASGFDGTEPGLRTLGYPEAFACLRGRVAPAEGEARLLRSTLAYAKRQRTWFRNQVEAVAIRGGATERMVEDSLEALRERAAIPSTFPS